MIYLDAVLGSDLYPIYNGTAEETQAWVREHEAELSDNHRVCIGDTLALVTIDEYLRRGR